LNIRDPFVFYDPNSKAYYIHANRKPYFEVFKSTDLKNWESEGHSFTRSEDFWGEEDFWAPDAFFHNGKYYIFATFRSDKVNNGKRGTSVLISDSPEGPFKALDNKPLTPEDWTCLDGTLYIDDSNQPWFIFCHEWIETINGEVWAQKISEDFKTVIGDPVLLFKAQDAEWVGTAYYPEKDIRGYVTDGATIYRASNGELLMIWSSYDKDEKYAMGILRSSNGKLTGKWTHDPLPLNSDDGGHSMIFQANGKTFISYHAPNSGETRVVIRELIDDNGKITLGDKL